MSTPVFTLVTCPWCCGRGKVDDEERCPACRGFEVAWGEQPFCIHCVRQTLCPACGGIGVFRSVKKEDKHDSL